MSIIDTLVTDRVPGATYDWQDMNRVAEAMEYVAGRLRAYEYDIEVSPQRFTHDDFPSPAVFANYLGQLGKLRGVLMLPITTPPVPGVSAERPYMTVQEANDIERILAAIEKTINQVVGAFRRSNAPFFWSGNEPLPTAESDLGRTWEELDAMGTGWENWQAADWYLLLYGDLKAEGEVADGV